MNKIITLLFILLMSVLLPSRSFSQNGEEDIRIANEFIVMLQPTQSIENLLVDFPELKSKECLSKRMNIWLLECDPSNSEKSLSLLLQHKVVKLAQYNHRIQQRSLIPNDPFFSQQWNMLNTSQSAGLAGADIDATEAWAINNDNITAEGDTVVIAVIDVNFDLHHEDINYFINYGEVDSNGIDDDGNGYIDDRNGWNVFSNTGQVSGPVAHSTHISGIAAGIGNNGKGIAGVCWGAKILPISGSSSHESEVVKAYDYVRTMRLIYNNTFGNRGAFIVSTNSSFGADGGNPVNFPIWCAMYDSMGAVGILSAGATANSGIDVETEHDIPSECPSKWFIGVTNTNRFDQRDNAAYGKTSVDLGAPGTQIMSTVPGGYSNMNGTSQATPHVAGTVAAMYAAACKAFIDAYYEYPDSVALLVKKYLLDGAEWISSMNNKTVTNGRLNLLRAILNLKRFDCDSCHFNIDIDKVPISCKGSSDGAMAVTVDTGSIFDYAIIWSNQLTTPECLSMDPGFYSVTVRDTNTGCRRFSFAELHDPDSILISAINIIAPGGGNNGNITIVAAAGNEPLTYSIDGNNFQPTATFSIAVRGTYTVFVKNSSGCVVAQDVVVSGLDELSDTGLQLTIFPIPASEELIISYSSEKNIIAEFSILDIVGDLAFKSLEEIYPGYHSFPLDISSLQSGIYFLQNNGEIRKFAVVR